MTADDRSRIAAIAGAVFNQQRALAGVPAMAAAVVQGGEIVGFTGHNAREDTLFRIASMTKSFTAAAVLVLRDAGALRLDDAIADHAPEFTTLAGPTSDAPVLTIRHLLTMSAGLATDDPWGDRHLDWSDAELDQVAQAGPLFAIGPGTGFEYSNFGYGILGRIIRHVSGRRAQAFIRERLLEPLGMDHTVWTSADAPEGCDVPLGLRADGVTPEPQLADGALATMGGLYSTVRDLARWVGFMADAWPARDGPDPAPLCRSSRREMQSGHTLLPPMTVRSADGAQWRSEGAYGMGLQVNHDEQLGQIIGHSGGLPGYGSNMSWVRGTRWGVVALANRTYAPMSHVNRRVLQALAASGLLRRPAALPERIVEEAGTALAGLLAHWSDSAAERLFADNVDLDRPLAERRRDAADLLARFGALELARIEPDDAASGRLILHSDSAELRIPFSLAPNGRLQKYDLP